MSNTYSSDDERRSLREKRDRERAPDLEHGYGLEAVGESSVAPSGLLLGDSRLGGRGNLPERASVMRRAQQTYGNRAIQRLLQVQRTPSYVNEVGDDDLAHDIAVKSGEGDELDEETRLQLEKGLEENLSHVRIHIDAQADHMARAVKASAFTSGRNIFFQAGSFNPKSETGLELLAHHAVHAVQQSRGPVDGKPTDAGVALSDPSDTFEQEAERTADEMMAKQNESLQRSSVEGQGQKTKLEEQPSSNFSSSTIYVQRSRLKPII